MEYINNEFKEFSAQHYVFDTWQFLLSTHKNIVTSEYCSKIIKNSIEEILDEHCSFQE